MLIYIASHTFSCTPYCSFGLVLMLSTKLSGMQLKYTILFKDTSFRLIMLLSLMNSNFFPWQKKYFHCYLVIFKLPYLQCSRCWLIHFEWIKKHSFHFNVNLALPKYQNNNTSRLKEQIVMAFFACLCYY